MTFSSRLTALCERPKEALWAVAFAALAIVILSSALQYLGGLTPCPLCLLQRALFLCLGLTALTFAALRIGALWQQIGVIISALIALGGAAVAIRHLWIQSDFAEQAVSCGPSTSYLIETLPLWDLFLTLLDGSGDCANVHPVLGVPLPLWSLLAFVFSAGILIAAHCRARR